MAQVISGLTDDDIRTEWRDRPTLDAGDDDATDAGDAVDTDDDATDTDDDASDSDTDTGDSDADQADA